MGARRRRRVLLPGATYHVYTRGTRKSDLFLDDEDREKFLSYLDTAAERYELVLDSYSLMDNHVHLQPMTRLPNLSAAMQMLFGSYGGYFNRKYVASGHVFEARYFSPILEPGTRELGLSRYVHRNAFVAGLVARAEDWKWCSYPAYLGLVKPPRWLRLDRILSLVAGPDPLRTYREFVEASEAEGGAKLAEIYEREVAVGSDAFCASMERGPSSGRMLPAVSEVLEIVRTEFSYPGLILALPERPPHPARFAAAALLARMPGLHRGAIGAALGGVTPRTVTRYLRECERLLAEDEAFLLRWERCLRGLT